MALSSYSLTRGPKISDLLVSEINPEIGRENKTLLAGSGADRTVKMGTVMGKITTSGKIVALDTSGSDGSENFDCIMLHDATAADGVDEEGVLTLDSLCKVKDTGLIWPDGISAADKAAAIAQMNAVHIKVA